MWCHFRISVLGFENGFIGMIKHWSTEMQKAIREVTDGLIQFSNVVDNIEKVWDSDAATCRFQCPNNQPYISNTNYKPVPNGCGSFGFDNYLIQDMLPSEFGHCCDTHDICYGTCGTNKAECDLNFHKCLYAVCDSRKQSNTMLEHRGCQGTAKILYTGTTALGCLPFITSQHKACLCVPKFDEDGRWRTPGRSYGEL